MRCKACNVDLSETYTICPLCGEKAIDEPARLQGLKPAPYPHNVPVKKAEDEKKEKTPFSIEKIKAYFSMI
ncbi:MAG: hypothetical protein IJW86_08795 [Clostridia bacterium]|nr:hypothetical protein [Clostridia bacterium]